MKVDSLPTPALLLDLDVLESNLDRMAERATTLGVALRPHVKTHKCIEIGREQLRRGASGVTVATLYEAGVFADHGFDDITWAFPLILNRIDEAKRLADRVTLRLVVDSHPAVKALEQTDYPFHVWMKVDCGYHRAGVDPQSDDAITVARALTDSPKLVFDGILTHSGHSYHARGDALPRIAEEERHVMVDLAERLRGKRIPVREISVGSTPAMNAAASLDGVTEARPGNYALYDFSQSVIGSCTVQHCAATVLASVVSTHPALGHSIIDAGALALSKDTGPEDSPHRTMGEIFAEYGAGTLRPDVRVVSVSQEHGFLSAPIPIGSRVRILPNHSCLTVAQFDEFHVVRGEEVVDTWKIWRSRT